MADPNLGQLAATTLQDYGDLIDDVTNNNALLSWMKKGGFIETRSEGGRTFLEPMVYKEVGNAKFYDGGQESFVIPVESVISASEWDRKFQAGFVYFTESERQANKGKAAQIRLVDGKLLALKSTLANDFSTSVYADGTGSNEPEGLQSIVPDDPTSGTVGGINAGTAGNEFWRNQANTSTTASSSNIITTMTNMHLTTVRGMDKPDLVVAGTDMFTYYNDSLQADQRYIDWNSADVLNFEGLRFQNSVVLHDPTCATKRLYGLNTKHFKLICDSGRRWSPGSHREITKQLVLH